MARLICGIDEAGRGSIAGPMVVAAVVLWHGHRISGVKDSKRVQTYEQLTRLYDRVYEEAIWKQVVVVKPVDIDGLGLGVLWKDAVRSLLVECKRCCPGGEDGNIEAVVDGTQRIPRPPLKTEFIKKADATVPAVSAASILAKWTQVLWANAYDRKHPGYGFAQHRGYGTVAHWEVIKNFGVLDDHRKSFIRAEKLPKLQTSG